jgi:hypothetical protein
MNNYIICAFNEYHCGALRGRGIMQAEQHAWQISENLNEKTICKNYT